MTNRLSIMVAAALAALAAGGCAEDPTPGAPAADVVRRGLLEDLTDEAYRLLPHDEWQAAEDAASACRQPLASVPQAVEPTDIRAFYKHPVAAMALGGELYAPGFFDSDPNPCGWYQSAMLAHALLKCVATHLHQAAIDSSRELPFDSRMRLIGRARFAYLWTVWEVWAEATHPTPIPSDPRSAPYRCDGALGAVTYPPLVRPGNENTVEWFMASVAESIDALGDLGRRQAAMIAAQADERRGEVPDLLALQTEVFDPDGRAMANYRRALWYLVGERSSPSQGLHKLSLWNYTPRPPPIFCQRDGHIYYPYDWNRTDFDGMDDVLGGPQQFCFMGTTVDGRRSMIRSGLALLSRRGPMLAEELAAAEGRASIEELGITAEGWAETVHYWKEDATLTALYPDGPRGPRLDVPPFIYRTQIMDLNSTYVSDVGMSNWDEVSVTEALEWVRWFVLDEVRSQFDENVADVEPGSSDLAENRRGLLEVMRIAHDEIDAELGAVKVVAERSTSGRVRVIVSGLDEADSVALGPAGRASDPLGRFQGYVCGTYGRVNGVGCTLILFGEPAPSSWEGCEGRCVQWRVRPGQYYVILNGKFAAFIDGDGLGATSGVRRVTRIGGVLGAAVEDLVRFDPSNASSLLRNSLGIDWSTIPPLENSLISDEDPYEDSFSWYLTLAQSAAASAAEAADSAREARYEVEVAGLDRDAAIANSRADQDDQLAELCGAGVSECAVPRGTYTLEGMGLFADIPPSPRDDVCESATASVDPPPSEVQALIDGLSSGLLGASAWEGYLDALRIAFDCEASRVVEDAAKVQLYDLPQALDDGTLSDSEGHLFGGETRVILGDLAIGLDEIRLAIESIRATFEQLRNAVESERLRMDQLDDFGRAFAFRVMIAVGGALADTAESIGISGPGAALKMAGEVGLAELEFEHELSAFQEELNRFRGQVLEMMSRVKSLGIQLDAAYQGVAANVARLDQVEASAAAARARGERLAEQATRRYELESTHGNLLLLRALHRARRSFEDGVRKAFVARRAIEFRLGLDLEMERGRHTFVEPPQEWVNDIFRISVVGDPTAPGTGTGVDLDLVDYVDRLRLYVESYPFDHPFTDGLDVAVISLRDDVVRSEPLCGVAGEPDNLARWSEDLDEARTWQSDEAVTAGLVIEPWSEEPPAVAGSYGDPVLCDGQWRWQFVAMDDAAEGEPYTFSVWVAPATETDQEVGIGLYFWGEGGAGPVWYPVLATSAWQRIEIAADRPGSGGGYIVPFIAARRLSDGTSFASYAWGAQLEHGDHAGTYRPTMDSTATFVADDHVGCAVELDATGHFLEADPSPDWEGDVFRTAFSVACADGTGPTPIPEALARECTIEWLANGMVKCAGADGAQEIGELLCSGTKPDGLPYGGVAYYELPFSFHQAAIAEGDLFAEESFATGNYNYRIDRLALNVVGTNVRNCALSDYPAGCYSRAVTPYSLVEGGGVTVRNYRGWDVPFTMPAAWIHDAKALTAERVITTPITSADQALLADVYRAEFRGRPVEGSYSLQVQQTDALDFDAIEDIQLILYYRYWSASEMSKSARETEAGEGRE